MLVVGLIHAIITFLLLAWALHETYKMVGGYDAYLGLMAGPALSNVMNIINTAALIVKPIDLFYCLRGFGHLIINSDKLVRMQQESTTSFINRAVDETMEREGGGE